jgi:hypothetical protein
VGAVLLQDTIARGTWPATTVRDTVVAITQDAAYDRSVTASVWEYLLGWFADALFGLLDILPDWDGGRFLVVGLAVLLVVLIAARIVLQSRARREHWAGVRGTGGARRSTDSMVEAERLAAAGDYLAAAHHLCAALLAASARRGEVTLHPAKTTGDYAREMRRRRAPSEQAFQRFRTRYDRVVYDLQACSPDEYSQLVEAARPMLTRERAGQRAGERAA